MRSSSVIELDEPVRALQRVENRARPRPIVTRPRLTASICFVA
jgi:hypothetical protein